MALEFRSHKDDAWYDVRLVTEDTGGDRRLRVKFANFSDDQDEIVNAKDLKSLDDVSELRSRVRKLSIQLQDSECSKVEKGLRVCAARSVGNDDRRFYDALIDEVVHEGHSFVKGEQQCTCRIILEWIHGPEVGTLTSLALENICRVQLPASDEEIDPVLTSFLNTVKEKIQNTCSNSTTATSLEKGSCDTDTSRLSKRHKASSSQRSNKDSPARRYVASWSSKEMIGNPFERDGHDMDIGGVPHVLFVENLEKGLSAVTIMQFLYQQVSVSCKAIVLPSKSSESYTRATIILDNKKNLEKLSMFLESPDRIIISSRGRPWVVSEEKLLDDTLKASVEVLKLTSQTAILESTTLNNNDLKVAISGSREYRKAKMLKFVFEEFANHQCGLHQRLFHEEGKILQLPM